MPPKSKSPEFVKYDITVDPCGHLHKFCRKMAPYGDNYPLLCQNFPNSLIGLAATWYVRLEKTSSWREMANAFLEYYRYQDSSKLHSSLEDRKEKWGIFL